MSYIQNRNLYQRIRGYTSQEDEDDFEENMGSSSIEDIRDIYNEVMDDMIWSRDPGAMVITRLMWRNDKINKERNYRSNIISLYYSEIV